MRENPMNRANKLSKFIIFSSNFDDAGMLRGAFSGVDSPFWEEFNGKDCFRFFTMLAEEQGSYSAYDSLQGAFDFLVIWEPPPDGHNDGYADLLQKLEQEIVDFGGMEGSDVLVGYHRSCKSEDRLVQEQFIKQIAATSSRVVTNEYSHIENDMLYVDATTLLKKTVTGNCLRDEYLGLLENLSGHWFVRSVSLPYMNALFLFLDTLLGQDAMRVEEEGYYNRAGEWWRRFFENEGPDVLIAKLGEESKIIKVPRLTKTVEELFALVEDKVEPDNAMLEEIRRDLMELLSEACR
jgi:hypothetical protein